MKTTISKAASVLLLLFSITFLKAQTDSTAAQKDSLSKAQASITTIVKTIVSPRVEAPFANLFANASRFNQATISTGFISNNAIGFANSFSYGVNEFIDSTQNFSAVFGAPVGELLYSELEMNRAVISPSVNTGNMGNAIGGRIDIETFNPFSGDHIMFLQQGGLSNKEGAYNRTAFNFFQAYGKQRNIALAVSASFDLKRE